MCCVACRVVVFPMKTRLWQDLGIFAWRECKRVCLLLLTGRIRSANTTKITYDEFRGPDTTKCIDDWCGVQLIVWYHNTAMVWYKEYANLLNESESKYSYMIVVKMYLVLSTTPVLLELIQVSHITFNTRLYYLLYMGFLIFTLADFYKRLCRPELSVVPRKKTAGNMWLILIGGNGESIC